MKSRTKEAIDIVKCIFIGGVIVLLTVVVGNYQKAHFVDQAEQTGISAARDTQRIEALLTKQDELISDLTALQKEWYGEGFPYLTTARDDCGSRCHG